MNKFKVGDIVREKEEFYNFAHRIVGYDLTHNLYICNDRTKGDRPVFKEEELEFYFEEDQSGQ